MSMVRYGPILCFIGAQNCPTKILAAYDVLALAWLVAKILAAYLVFSTLLTPTSQVMPKFSNIGPRNL